MEQASYRVGIGVWFICLLEFRVRGGSVLHEGRFRGVKGGSNRWVLGLVSRESCGGVEGCGKVKVEFEKEVVVSGVRIGFKVSDFVLVRSFVCVWCQVVYLMYCDKIIVRIRRRYFRREVTTPIYS